MSKTRSPNRDVATILAEQEAKTEALRQRAAIAQAKNSPELAPLLSAIKNANKDLQRDSIILGNGPQGADSKRTSHSLWISVINAEENLANLESDHNKVVKGFFQDLLSDLSSRIANGEKFTEEVIVSMMAGIPERSEDIENARDELEVAQSVRAAHTAKKKERKRTASE